MLTYLAQRSFHTSCRFLSSMKKSHLAKLRKRTGYTFVNCRRALELHQNDLEKAEEWLHEQAQAQGWAKAEQLQGRSTKQGLVGIYISERVAGLVEVNCETDFVAHTDKFCKLVQMVASSYVDSQSRAPGSGDMVTAAITSDNLGKLPAADGRTLADHLALTIGRLGENMVIRRGSSMLVAPNSDIKFAGYSHPPSVMKDGMVGKYGGIIAYRQVDPDAPLPENLKIEHFAKQLCQHVVGMNPSSLGKEDDEPVEDLEDESRMLLQEFLLDSQFTVREILQDTGVQIVDYMRYECGEETTESEMT